MSYRHFIHALCCYTLVLFCGQAQATTDKQQLVALLAHTRTLTANFEQYDQSEHETVESTGRLSLARPNKFRWEIIKPDQQLIVADGRNLWHYDKSLAQVTVQPLGEQMWRAPALLLSGDAASLLEAYQVMRKDTHTYVLTPTNKVFKKLTIVFDDHAMKYLVLEAHGHRTRIVLQTVKLNNVLNPKLFTFRPPHGVDVVGEPSIS